LWAIYFKWVRVYKQKETELINILRKDLTGFKEHCNGKGVLKSGKRVVNSLIKLKIYDEVKIKIIAKIIVL